MTSYKISSTVLLRICATCSAVRSAFKASNVALTTLILFVERKHFALISLIPAISTTERTVPPAIIPVPGAAGLRRTLPAPYSPIISCGIVVLTTGTSIKFFFASSIAFLIASGVSAALPIPYPT